MYRLNRTEFVQGPFSALWATLAFQAGFINAFGFIACGRYVSHVTGFGTQIGMSLAENQLWQALELVGFPLAFIFGAFVNGLLTAARLERNRHPRFDWVTFAMPVMILAIWFLGRDGDFGVFSEPLLLPRDFYLLFSLSFICGMQNACFAVMTHGQIRTTHLTGISTDIGTDTARLWFGGLGESEHTLTRKINTTRIITFLNFAIGSVTSVWMSGHFEFDALLVPAFLSTAVFVMVRINMRRIDAGVSNTKPSKAA